MPDVQLDGLDLCCRTQPTRQMIDFNGHVSAVWFVDLFEEAAKELQLIAGMGHEYRRRTNCGFYLGESHIQYCNEVFEGDQLDVYYRVIDHSDIALHVMLVMVDRTQNYVAAIQEALYWHKDLTQNEIVPLQPAAGSSLMKIRAEQEKRPTPFQLGRRIAIRKRE